MEITINEVTEIETPHGGEEEMSLSAYWEDKLKQLDESAKDKTSGQIVQIRVQQLGIAKLLCTIHGKPISFLVTAHCKLGEAYLNDKCCEQAVDHLTTALKKNNKLFSEKMDAKKYHAHILTLIGKTYLEMNNMEQAVDLLQKALEMTQVCYGNNNIQCTGILTLLANCCTKNQDYERALDYMASVWEVAEAHYGTNSESCAIVCIETAKIDAKRGDFEKAIVNQKMAINILVDLKIEKNPEYIANLYSTLSNYEHMYGDIEGYIDSLDKVKKIYIDLYGEMDKRSIKIKKSVALGLLKVNRNEEALQELLETELLQKKFYGEDSLQLAKTCMIIGAIFFMENNFLNTQRYYTRALNIFEENGIKPAVADLKKKIKVAKEMRERALLAQSQQGGFK